MSAASERTDFVEALPGVLLPLEPLDSLRLSFLQCFRHRQPLYAKKKNPRVR